MSKWRPNKLNCLYVIPDIHGASDLLENILKRILPLRKSDGGQDKIIFLGDYIDRGLSGHKVLDKLIELKKTYSENVICLCGNHELMFLYGLGYLPAAPSVAKAWYDMWEQEGGLQTKMGYMERHGIDKYQASNYTKGRFKDLIPKEHIEFLLQLDGYYEQDNFVFVHGGCEPDKSPAEFDLDVLAWDRSLYRFVVKQIEEQLPLPWHEKTIITGHNTNGSGFPIIKDQYMMLDCGSPKRLLIIEAYSRKAYMALPSNNRLVKFELMETVYKRKPGLFKRVN